MKKPVVILQDTREKKPLLFPEWLVCFSHLSPSHHPVPTSLRILVKRVTLPFGDYMLEGAPSGTIIERKASLSEVAVNLFDKQRRSTFQDRLRQLRDSCARPVLLFEGDPADLRKTWRGTYPAEVVVDALCSLVIQYGVTPLFLRASSIEQRREAAKVAAWLLIRGTDSCPPTPQPSSVA